MDGPSVNWKFLDDFKTRMRSDGSDIVSIGSCGLHILHGAFKDAFVSTEWNLDDFFKSLYWLFKDCPARREDYTRITGSSSFPPKFCKHRWVENKSVAEAALLIIPDMKKFVQAVETGKVTKIKTKSFETVKKHLSDPSLSVKIKCFISISAIIEIFLVSYQTDDPMLPFLADDLAALLRKLLTRIMGNGEVSKLSTYQLSQESELKAGTIESVDIGFDADRELKSLLRSKKISDRAALQIKGNIRDAVLVLVKKMQKKCPLKYSLVRNLNCLNPLMVAASSKNAECFKKFDGVLNAFVNAKKVEASKCDVLRAQYNDFLTETVVENVDVFSEFDRKRERVDELYAKYMNTEKYRDLFAMVKLILILSHGQASVERGFSIMKQMMKDNLSEDTFTSQRIVIDHIKSVGGCVNVKINTEMKKEVKMARQRYTAYLEAKKHESENQLERRNASWR